MSSIRMPRLKTKIYFLTSTLVAKRSCLNHNTIQFISFRCYIITGAVMMSIRVSRTSASQSTNACQQPSLRSDAFSMARFLLRVEFPVGSILADKYCFPDLTAGSFWQNVDEQCSKICDNLWISRTTPANNQILFQATTYLKMRNFLV